MMARKKYASMIVNSGLNRRDFMKTVGACSVAAGGLVLGVPAFGQQKDQSGEVETNIADFLKIPKNIHLRMLLPCWFFLGTAQIFLEQF